MLLLINFFVFWGPGIVKPILQTQPGGKQEILFQEVRSYEQKDTMVFKVEDYGALGDGESDDGPVLRKLFERVSGLSAPAKIVFREGSSYYMGPHAPAHGRLMLLRAQNVLVEGNHCRLIIHPSNLAFGIYRSKNVVIRNFRIDYFPLPYTQGRITRIDNQSGYLEFKVDKGFPLPKVADSSYYVNGRLSDCVTINGENLKFYQGHSRISDVKDLGNNSFGVTYRMHRQYKAGINDYFAMKVKYPGGRDSINSHANSGAEMNEMVSSGGASISANQCRGLKFENIISNASPEMTICTRGCSGVNIDRLIVIRKPGRVIAGCSDGIHLKGNESQPVIENCYIEGTMDDAIHVKISGDKIIEVGSPGKVRICHMDVITDNTNLGTGKRVMIFSPSSNRQLAMSVISGIEYIDYRNAWITFEENVPGIKAGDCLYLQAENEAIIRNSQFGTQLQRAILTHQPTLIIHCAIIDNGKGLDQALSTAGIEGPPSQRVIFENCAFVNLSNVALDVKCPSKDYDQLAVPQLKVENCLFNLPDGIPALKALNSAGVSLTGNHFCYQKKEPDKDNYFQLTNCQFIDFRNNIFRKGWMAWDSDEDGLADVLEPEGDSDQDGISNQLDKDSNNNGIMDGDEFKSAMDPYKKWLQHDLK